MNLKRKKTQKPSKSSEKPTEIMKKKLDSFAFFVEWVKSDEICDQKMLFKISFESIYKQMK